MSNRFTPTLIGFGGDQRLLGEAAKTQVIFEFLKYSKGLNNLFFSCCRR